MNFSYHRPIDNFEPPVHEYRRTEYYTLADGRIWSIYDAKFVSEVPEGALAIPAYNREGVSNLEGLITTLDDYGFPKGELKTDAEYAAEAREKRNKFIAETDYLVMPDYPLPDDKRQAVLSYRQFLRDIPEQSGFPRQINWPEKNF